MAPQFFSQEIKVALTDEVVPVPASFRLGEQEHLITEIVEAWSDYGFGQAPLRRKKWWQRRHRNYYRVKTADNEVFEIYYDRGTNLKHPERKKWFLYRQL